MLKSITCYLSGKHNYLVAREPGAMFLRCNHCGRRTNGWELRHEGTRQAAHVALQPARRPASAMMRVLRKVA
jgi:hypothetical protein